MASIGQFLREVRAEMTKVVWPTQRQLVVYTLVVIVASLVLAFFLGALDLIFQKLLTEYLIQ